MFADCCSEAGRDVLRGTVDPRGLVINWRVLSVDCGNMDMTATGDVLVESHTVAVLAVLPRYPRYSILRCFPGTGVEILGIAVWLGETGNLQGGPKK